MPLLLGIAHPLNMRCPRLQSPYILTAMRKRHPRRIALIGRVLAALVSLTGAVHALAEAPRPEQMPESTPTIGKLELDSRTPYYRLRSERTVGDHGEIALDVSVTDSGCGLQMRFDHAELEIIRNRFGDAQFIRLPQPGCDVCEPILLRWMHEPTGYLEVNVNVFRREVDVPCKEGQ